MEPSAAGAAPLRFPSAEEEARALRRAELRMLRATLRQTWTSGRLRAAAVVVLSALLWMGLFRLLVEGFVFLRATVPPPTHDRIVQAVLSTFFATLLLMLLLSSAVILYGSLFRSREVAMLLTMPIREERIFLHKFEEAVVLSGWGFLLLGSPMLVAYGVVAAAPWYYYAMLPPLLVTFVYIPVALGAALCMIVIDRLPGTRAYFLAAAAVVIVAGGVWIFWSLLARPEGDLLTSRWFIELLGRLQLTEQRLLPSWWLSSALLETAAEAWSEGLLFLALMIANALFCRQCAVWVAAGIYRRAYCRVAGAGGRRRRASGAWIDGVAGWPAPVPTAVRLLLIKDLRLFRRDPMQWSQFVILFGLLLLYFINVRRFNSSLLYAGWVSMISLMNVSVVGLLMSTYTTRFVFPLISLEGRRFWFLGLLPLGRKTLLWSKFFFSVGSLLVPCSCLILLSDTMLRAQPLLALHHQLTCLLLCLGLSGIAVGLGARLPNLREQSPSRIAAGFGGTLNLVLSALYITAVILLMTLPGHLYTAAKSTANDLFSSQLLGLSDWAKIWFWAGTLGSLLLGATATTVPMWIGLRAFRRLEF